MNCFFADEVMKIAEWDTKKKAALIGGGLLGLTGLGFGGRHIYRRVKTKLATPLRSFSQALDNTSADPVFEGVHRASSRVGREVLEDIGKVVRRRGMRKISPGVAFKRRGLDFVAEIIPPGRVDNIGRHAPIAVKGTALPWEPTTHVIERAQRQARLHMQGLGETV